MPKAFNETLSLCRSLSTFRHTDPAFKEVLASAAHHLAAMQANQQKDETGWLIELRPDNGPPKWLDLSETLLHPSWTADSSKALRFARRDDAEAYYAFHIDDMPHTFITEHMWLDARSPTQKNEEGK